MYFPRINAYLESLYEALSRTEKRTVQEMVEVCRTPLVKNCSSPALADNARVLGPRGLWHHALAMLP